MVEFWAFIAYISEELLCVSGSERCAVGGTELLMYTCMLEEYHPSERNIENIVAMEEPNCDV